MKHIGLFEGIGGFSLAARWMGWAQRKSYSIHACTVKCDCSMMGGYTRLKCHKPGTIVEAELIDENTVRVVKIVND